MKNLSLLILSIVFLSSCGTPLSKIQSEPSDWTIEPVIVLDWDGNHPANRWYTILELNKLDTTINGVPFIIKEISIPEGDSTKKVLVIEAQLDETYKVSNEMFR